MNRLEATLRRAVHDLTQRGQAWALVGGLAVSARTEPRFTRDVDVAATADNDEAAEFLVRSLLAEGYRIFATVEQDATGRLATVRLGPPSSAADEVIVDILFASSGIEPEIVAAAEPIEIAPGLVVPVARIGHLIAVKLLAREDEARPQDLADLRVLCAAASPSDLSEARDAVALIEARGFARGRDLAAALTELRQTSR